MSSRGQSARSALNRDTFPVTIYVLSRHGGILERKTHVIGNEEIEMPVPIVVKKTTARSPAWLFVPLIIPKSGSLGDIGKRSISVVAIQPVLPEVSTEDVLESVVVVVADAHAGRPSHGLQPSLLGDIRKSTIAIVLVKAVRRFRRISSQPRARQQKNVHPTVVVVVDEGTSTTDRFQNIFLAINTAVYHRSMQTGCCGDVHKMRIERTARRRRPGYRLDRVSGNSLPQESWRCRKSA